MNRIIDKIIKQKNGRYCHVLELGSVYELECCIEQLYSEFKEDYFKEEIIDFFETMQIYYYKEDSEEECNIEEEELYNFNIANFINDMI